MFGSMKRCARCQAAILASELVMRARELVFHVRCFSCAACTVPLTKGDHFGMRDGAVLCRLHYEMGAELHPSQSPPVPVYPPGPHYPGQPFPSPEFVHHQPHHIPPHPHHTMHPQHPHQLSHTSPVSLQPSTPSGPEVGSPPKVPYFNGAAQVVGAAAGVPPPRQKGRPRKRKPKDLEAMTASLGELFYHFLLLYFFFLLLFKYICTWVYSRLAVIHPFAHVLSTIKTKKSEFTHVIIMRQTYIRGIETKRCVAR